MNCFVQFVPLKICLFSNNSQSSAKMVAIVCVGFFDRGSFAWKCFEFLCFVFSLLFFLILIAAIVILLGCFVWVVFVKCF